MNRATSQRPTPPADLGQPGEDGCVVDITPAEGMREWILKTFVEEGAPLYNEDHAHLVLAHFECLWASRSYVKQGRTVLGLTEQVAFRVSGWQRWRQEQQLREWFGDPFPDYLITLDAEYSRIAADDEFCALVEHELYHIGHKRDAFDALDFTDEGLPKLYLRGHDVEEFIGVVRRYGVGHEDGALSKLVQAASRAPEVSRLRVQQACGTCLLRLVA